MKTIQIYPSAHLAGSVTIPGDKSISHRALMLASIAKGLSRIENLLEGHDCLATVQVMRALGSHIALTDGVWTVDGRGKEGLIEPDIVLDCKNSGTTIRLMAGLLSGMPFMTVLDGTSQIKSRPMGRVIEPLQNMGARIFGRKDNTCVPIVTLPASLRGLEHHLKVKSAQVKSALILAGLYAKNTTRITNTKATRNHTEIMLQHMGATIGMTEDAVEVTPLAGELAPLQFMVPGDTSSAAFLMVAGLLLANDSITLKRVLVNHTRTGIIDALRHMGGHIELMNESVVAGEQVADLRITKSELKGAAFGGDHIVRMIDEIPILALAATQSHGETVIRDASELKVKESNRIVKTVELLSLLGADIKELDDGMIIRGPTKLHGGRVSSFGDHRLALLACIAGLVGQNPIVVEHAEVIDDSFPGFIERVMELGGSVCEV